MKKDSKGHILIVDDNEMNREVLAMLMRKQGSTFAMAENGKEALDLAHTEDFDIILLDVMMPVMDGFETLMRLKEDKALAHIPVIMISAIDEIDSVVRCIGMGATDYLPKPFKAPLLSARINSSLAAKRLRDLELEYLEQVSSMTAAAARIEAGDFDENSLTSVAGREDALGNLARVFVHMAREVRAREQRLRLELEQLRSDMDDQRRSAGDSPSSYVPMDRRKALENNTSLPDRATGCALFADISGYTKLTETLSRELGPLKGAEEVTRQINRVFDDLVNLVHLHGGSVITYGGDAMTCWFDADGGMRSAACAVAMQAAMEAFREIPGPAGLTLSLGVKVSVSAGKIRRLLVGDPASQNIEVPAGRLMDSLAEGEHCAKSGEITLNETAVASLGGALDVAEWRVSPRTGERFARLGALRAVDAMAPWTASAPLPDETARPWLPACVFEMVRSGESAFLSELRPAAAILLNFDGIEYDLDDDAGRKLDLFTRHVQRIAAEEEGLLAQISTGDKGNSMCLVFGAPVAHGDDALRAVKAALRLATPPPEADFIRNIRVGVAHGMMRSGAYGSQAGRAYGVIGDPINLAARLMTACTAPGEIICDTGIRNLTGESVEFDALPEMRVKGREEPVNAFRPKLLKKASAVVDAMPAARRTSLKVAAALGPEFPVELLLAVHPVSESTGEIAGTLRELAEDRLIELNGDPLTPGARCRIINESVARAAYELMLFSQRRQLHHRAAEWYESRHGEDLRPYYAKLAAHWESAEELAKAAAYLERAGHEARARGAATEAESCLRESLRLETKAKTTPPFKAA
jgi:CheY-like chemotaxis protein/class 3 adenylate cyclase